MLRLVALTLLTLSISPALAKDPVYSPTAGEEIVFDVLRGSSDFGTHTVSFERDGDALITRIAIRLRAGVGPITVFRYEHDAVERWQGDQLIEMETRTLRDGETYDVEAVLDGGEIRVDGMRLDGTPMDEAFAATALPSSHWHGYPDGLDRVINTELGENMPVEVTYLGQSEIEADGGTIMADHFRMVGSVAVDLWYDESGRWAGCAFTVRGQNIRYVRRHNPAGA